MDELQLKLCDIQGRLFELSADKGYTSAAFVKAFMTSETAKDLDSKYNKFLLLVYVALTLPNIKT